MFESAELGHSIEDPKYEKEAAKLRAELLDAQYELLSDRSWDDYVVAASDMIDRTSTSYAPWTVLEANDKHLARVRAIDMLNARLEDALRG